MEEARVRELMALADALAEAVADHERKRAMCGPGPMAEHDFIIYDGLRDIADTARARLESALRQEPVDSHARQTFRPKEPPMNPMQEAMRPFSDLSGGEQEPQGGMSEETWPEPAGFRVRYRSEPGMIGHYPWTYADQGRRRREWPDREVEDLYTAEQVRAILAAAGGRK